MGRKVILVQHDPRWAELARQEAERVVALLPQEIERIEHIGSTAIPGIQAKPILDLAPVLGSLVSFDRRSAVLTELGYQARGEFGIPGRRYFTKTVDGIRTHQLHAYEADSPELERHLLFRDYLRAHPEAARSNSAERVGCRVSTPQLSSGPGYARDGTGG